MTTEENNLVFKKQLLGDVLVKRRLITQEQLKYALEVQRASLKDPQKKSGGYLGEILIKLGFVEERDIVVALVVQCNFPYIAVDQYIIDQSILQLVPKEFAVEHLLVPLDRVGNILSVVMVNPLDIAVRAVLHRITKYIIASFIATRAQIENTLDRWYRTKK